MEGRRTNEVQIAPTVKELEATFDSEERHSTLT